MTARKDAANLVRSARAALVGSQTEAALTQYLRESVEAIEALLALGTWAEGYAQGYDEGHDEGQSDGYDEGQSDGYGDGYLDGIAHIKEAESA